MVRLEGFMNVQQLHHDGVSISEIGRRLNLDRKTVRKYLKVAPQAYERQAKGWKIDPFRALSCASVGSWESTNSARSVCRDPEAGLLPAGATQVKKVVRPWRSEGQERAFVRFETAPGEQAQMDWGHFGNWGGKRLYGLAL